MSMEMEMEMEGDFFRRRLSVSMRHERHCDGGPM
jgi:hypothetical protein